MILEFFDLFCLGFISNQLNGALVGSHRLGGGVSCAALLRKKHQAHPFPRDTASPLKGSIGMIAVALAAAVLVCGSSLNYIASLSDCFQVRSQVDALSPGPQCGALCGESERVGYPECGDATWEVSR